MSHFVSSEKRLTQPRLVTQNEVWLEANFFIIILENINVVLHENMTYITTHFLWFPSQKLKLCQSCSLIAKPILLRTVFTCWCILSAQHLVISDRFQSPL